MSQYWALVLAAVLLPVIVGLFIAAISGGIALYAIIVKMGK